MHYLPKLNLNKYKYRLNNLTFIIPSNIRFSLTQQLTVLIFAPIFLGSKTTLKALRFIKRISEYIIVQVRAYVVRSKHCIHSRLITFGD